MDHIPIGHLVLIFAVDLLLLEVMSLIAAYAVGRASDSHRGGHYVLAVCLPVIGPLARYAYLVRTGRATLAVVRSDHRSVPLVSGCVAFTLGAAVIATSTWLDWVQGVVTADFRSHWGFEGGWSPADLAVTALATLGTAVLLVAAAALGAGLTMHGRIAVVCAAAGLGWLAVALDELVLMSAVNGAASDVSSGSGGHVGGALSAGWVSMARSWPVRWRSWERLHSLPRPADAIAAGRLRLARTL